jgi:hypothetical protein
MKGKIILVVVLAICFNDSFASVSVIVPHLNANEIYITVGKPGKTISLMTLSRINIRDLELLRGEKMKLLDQLSFKIAQKKLRNNINSDGTLNRRRLVKLLEKESTGKGGSIGGFALGSLLGPVGVLLAYLFKDPNKKNRVKWAWIGLIAFIPMWLLIFLILAIAIGYGGP